MQVITCPNCESRSVTERFGTDDFPYGIGSELVMLQANMPIMTCSACGQEWTDWRGEAARAEAVQAHLREARTER